MAGAPTSTGSAAAALRRRRLVVVDLRPALTYVRPGEGPVRAPGAGACSPPFPKPIRTSPGRVLAARGSPVRSIRPACSPASPAPSSAPPTTARSSAFPARVPAINALEPAIAALSDEALRAKTERVPQPHRGRNEPGRHPSRSLRRGARGGEARARDAPLRRAARRRHGAARGQDRRDEDRRGQDAGRHAARLPQRPFGPRRPCGHGERLPGHARRGVDGPRSTDSSAFRWASSSTG